ncbi:MAG: hypothetical protein V3571_06805 [Pseudodesulfovibrio sp.]
MRITIPRVHGRSPREKIIRSLALVLIFAAVCWGFIKNNERVVDMLNRDGAVYDETKTLDKDQRRFIASFTRTLKEEFGLSSRIQIYGGDFVVPELDAKTMYIGLSPSTGEVQIRFPALMRQALGDDLIEALRTEYLEPAIAAGEWPQELQMVLATIFQKLTELNKDGASGE